MIPARDLGEKAIGWGGERGDIRLSSALEAGDQGMVGAILTVQIKEVKCDPQC